MPTAPLGYNLWVAVAVHGQSPDNPSPAALALILNLFCGRPAIATERSKIPKNDFDIPLDSGAMTGEGENSDQSGITIVNSREDRNEIKYVAT